MPIAITFRKGDEFVVSLVPVDEFQDTIARILEKYDYVQYDSAEFSGILERVNGRWIQSGLCPEIFIVSVLTISVFA